MMGADAYIRGMTASGYAARLRDACDRWLDAGMLPPADVNTIARLARLTGTTVDNAIAEARSRRSPST